MRPLPVPYHEQPRHTRHRRASVLMTGDAHLVEKERERERERAERELRELRRLRAANDAFPRSESANKKKERTAFSRGSDVHTRDFEDYEGRVERFFP